MRAPVNTRLIKDYNLPTDGSYDIFFMDLVEGYPDGKVVFSLATTAEGSSLEGVSRRVTGVQKTAQLFLKILFTRAGSDPLYPNRGTYISDLIRTGNMHSEGEMDGFVRQEVSSASEQVIALTSSAPNAGERLASAELTTMDIGVNMVSIGIRVITEDGEFASVYAPFPRFDMNFNV
jgi:hypothetical protein